MNDRGLRRKLWIVAITAVGLILSSCQSSLERQETTVFPLLTPAPLVEVKPVLTRQQITPANVVAIKELRLFSTNDPHPIADLRFVKENQEILAANAFSGWVQGWGVARGSVTHRVNIGPTSVLGTEFSPDGKWVAVVAGVAKSANEAHLTSPIKGTSVLSASTGEVVWQEEASENPWALSYSELAWSGNNLLLASVNSSGFNVIETTSWKPIKNVVWIEEDFNKKDPPSLVAISFDISGKWIIIGDTAGTVFAHSLMEFGIQSFPQEAPDPALRVSIGPTNRYIATIGTMRITVWDTLNAKKWFSDGIHIQSTHPYTPAADLAFSPDGKLLAVGTKTMWQIWSVEEGKLLKEYPQGSYALTFSPDDRLFAWGDLEGNVHIWGVPD